MPTRTKRYDVDRLRDDMEARGWMPADLFRYAKITRARGYNFMSGVRQTPRTADALTYALGKPQGHYLIRRVPLEKVS